MPKSRNGQLLLTLGAILAIAIALNWVSQNRHTIALRIGRTYTVTRAGSVCLDPGKLVHGSFHQVSDGSPHSGCTIINRGEELRVLGKDAALVRVRVMARLHSLNGFEGWTQARNLEPARHEQSGR